MIELCSDLAIQYRDDKLWKIRLYCNTTECCTGCAMLCRNATSYAALHCPSLICLCCSVPYLDVMHCGSAFYCMSLHSSSSKCGASWSKSHPVSTVDHVKVEKSNCRSAAMLLQIPSCSCSFAGSLDCPNLHAQGSMQREKVKCLFGSHACMRVTRITEILLEWPFSSSCTDTNV